MRFGSSSKAPGGRRLALSRAGKHLPVNARMTIGGYAIPSGFPDVQWWGDLLVSPNTTTNGASVSSYTERKTGYDVLTNTGTGRPTYSTTGNGGQPCLIFNPATSQHLFGTDPAPPYPGFGRCLIMCCQIHAAPSDDATPYLNSALWADHSFGYQGLYVRSSGKIQAYWYDGVSAAGWTSSCIEASFTFDVPLVIVAHLRGNLLAGTGSMELQVNNGAKQVSAAVIHTRNSIQAPMRLARGNNAVATLDCRISDHISAFGGNTEAAYEVAAVARARAFYLNKFGV